jgi:hypothetical protein
VKKARQNGRLKPQFRLQRNGKGSRVPNATLLAYLALAATLSPPIDRPRSVEKHLCHLSPFSHPFV